MNILIDIIFALFLAFIWILCRACTLAEREEQFEA